MRFAPAGRVVALLTPLLALGVPLFDTAFVMWIRWRQGRSPVVKSPDHCALRWILQGTAPQTAVRRLWWLGAGCAAAALTVLYTPNLIGAVVVLLTLAGFGLVARSASRVPTPPHDTDPTMTEQPAPLEPTAV